MHCKNMNPVSKETGFFYHSKLATRSSQLSLIHLQRLPDLQS